MRTIDDSRSDPVQSFRVRLATICVIEVLLLCHGVFGAIHLCRGRLIWAPNKGAFPLWPRSTTRCGERSPRPNTARTSSCSSGALGKGAKRWFVISVRALFTQRWGSVTYDVLTCQ